MTIEDSSSAFDDARRVAADEALTTTRAVRLRLDLERPVSDELLLECIDIAEQAPCGGAQPSRRWLVVREQHLRRKIGTWYREAAYPALREEFGWPVPGDPHFQVGFPQGNTLNERVFRSALHLAEHAERVPVFVLCAIYGEHDCAGSPGLFDSAIQAGWSFCIAARIRGLGSTWTTAHLARASEVAALLDIPAGVTQVALFPVAHALGDRFAPAERPDAAEITYFDRWGLRQHSPTQAGSVMLEIDIPRPPSTVWGAVVEAAGHLGDLAGAREPTGCSWRDAGLRGEFHLRPRVYGGTRLRAEAHFPAAAPADQSTMVEVRDRLHRSLAEIERHSMAR